MPDFIIDVCRSGDGIGHLFVEKLAIALAQPPHGLFNSAGAQAQLCANVGLRLFRGLVRKKPPQRFEKTQPAGRFMLVAETFQDLIQ